MASNARPVVGISALLLLTLLAPTAGAEERGDQLYDFCSQCHGAGGEGNRAALAPAIAGLPQWYVEGQLEKFRDGLRGKHFDDIPGMRMRPMSLWLKNREDLVAVAATVASMPRSNPAPILESGDATAGAALYTPCVVCHGADGSGNEQLLGPPLAGASDWYLLSTLKRFKAGIRGSNPADQYGIMMAAMAANLADEQAMKDVIAHIVTFSR
jgi:cytochrome c oxidase subunit 2